MGTRRHVTAGQETGALTGRSAVPVYDSSARLLKNPSTGEFEKIEAQWADNRKVITGWAAR
jgi:hypothetical protein